MVTRRAVREAQPERGPMPPDGLVVVDSSGWLEYLADTERAELFAQAIEDPARLVVPVITVYEVCKKAFREHGEHVALQIAGLMQQGRVIDIDSTLAIKAATLGLPLADSLIYATALAHGAVVWTQDEHFEGLPAVRYFAKQRSPKSSPASTRP